MEIVKDNYDQDIVIYINQIEAELHEFYSQFIPDKYKDNINVIDDYICNSTQNRFNAALMYIGNKLFKGNKALKLKPYTYNNNHIPTNNNKYDYEKLNIIADYYIYICSLYDKVVSFYGYSYLCGIDTNTVIGWNNSDRYRVSQEGIRIYQKLLTASEQSLSGMLTGKRNPVGVLGILNHLHNWSTTKIEYSNSSKQALTAADLPKLGNITKTDTYISDNNKSENIKKP